MNNNLDNNEYENHSQSVENSEEQGVSLYDKSNYYYTESEPKNDSIGGYSDAEQKSAEPERKKTLLWSVLSLIFGIVSIICCCFTGVGLVFAILSIVFSVVARKQLGYFDGLAIAGLILGIFGVVFGLATIILAVIGMMSGANFDGNIGGGGNNLPGINDGI